MYEKYAGVGSSQKPLKIKSFSFLKFFTDNDLFSEECPKVQAELLFTKNNKTKSSISCF